MTPEERGDADQKARSALAWFASSSAVWQSFSWVFTIFIARILTPEDYGLVALAGSFTLYLKLLTAFKLDLWMIQREECGEREEALVFTLTLAFSILVAGLCILIAPSAALFLGDPRIELIFVVLAISYFFHGFEVLPLAKLRRELNYKPIAVMSVVVAVLRSVITLLCAYLGYGYWALIAGQLFFDIARPIWLHLVCPLSRKLFFDKDLFKEAMRYGLYASGGSIFILGSTQIDDLLVGKLLGVEILGFYTMAYTLSEMPLAKLNQLVGSILTSYFSRLKSDREGLYAVFLKLYKNMAILIGPALVGMALIAPEFVAIILGEKWLPMVPMFQLMCVVWSLIACFGQVPRLLYAIDRPELCFYCSMVNFFILLLSFYFGIKYYGTAGLYFTWIFAYPATIAVLFYSLNRGTGISPKRYFLNFKVPILAVSLMALVTTLVRLGLAGSIASLPFLILSILVGATSYFLVMRFIFPEDSAQFVESIRSGGK